MGLVEHMNRFDPEKESSRIENFIADKQSEIGFNKGIIGLSGGIDSSLTTILSTRSLSAQDIEVVFLPESTTPERDKKDVDLLAQEFDLDVQIIKIDNFVSTFKDNLGDLSKLSVANLKARIRMVILYAIANEENGLVIGTGNLSESLLGYFTKYGDGAADISPLAHLYKAEVTSIAEYLDIPEPIITKPPSAGLWNDQTDEEELGGSYGEIDRVLYLNHDLDFGPEEVKEELDLDPGFVESIFARVKNSSHKREGPTGIEREETALS
ncbi:MAG: NAD+ synthase [Candidatus Bipolaricaulia bacterium]